MSLINVTIIALISYSIGFFLAKILDSREEYVNIVEIANQVTRDEGKKKSTDVAQVKEVLHIFTHKLAKLKRSQINYILNQYK